MRDKSGTVTTGWRPSGLGAACGGVAGFAARDLDLRSLVSYWHDVHVLVAAAALLGALLWRTPLKRLVAGTAALLACAWMTVAFTPLTPTLAAGLARRDPLRPADAVFVLASRIQDDGDLTSSALSRLVHGLRLVAEGHAPRLILSELHPPSAPYALPARELMRDFHITGELLTVGPVGNTRDEAVAVAQLGRARGFRRILLVTSPLHSRRASAAFEREGLDVVSSPCPEARYDVESLATPGERLMAFGGVTHERVGLWVYARRGWIAR
jgi:uncharacterized SAM-binding protein YcdF (DUF218 family)